MGLRAPAVHPEVRGPSADISIREALATPQRPFVGAPARLIDPPISTRFMRLAQAIVCLLSLSLSSEPLACFVSSTTPPDDCSHSIYAASPCLSKGASIPTPNDRRMSAMAPSQQDENMYSVPLIQYGSESATGSDSQLVGTNLTSHGELSSSDLRPGSSLYWCAGIFAGFSMEPMTEYPNYWTTSEPGTYEAACQLQSKSEEGTCDPRW